MHKIISFYNQNRKKIWVVLIAAIIIIALIYYLLYGITEDSNKNVGNNGESINEISNKLNSVSITDSKSVVSGTAVNTNENMLKTIDNFVEFCNNGEIEKAYNMISDDCKQEMFLSQELFQNIYYTPLFSNGKRNVTMENWIGDTYKVDFNEDFLATGKYTKENTKQDYITIVKQNDEYKLNINRFIGISNNGHSGNTDGINIKLNNIAKYMDYEIYTFEVSNTTEHTISLGSLDEEKSMYLVDGNGLKYPAYIHELSEAEISVSSAQTKTVKIKYYSKYTSNKNLKSVVFPNVILDYDSYRMNVDFYEGGYKSVNIDL